MNEFATEKHFNKIVVLYDSSVKCVSGVFPAKHSSGAVPQVCIRAKALCFTQLNEMTLSINFRTHSSLT